MSGVMSSGAANSVARLICGGIAMAANAIADRPSTPEGRQQQDEDRIVVVLLVCSAASYAFSKIAEAFVGVLPCLILAAKAFEVICWTSTAICAIAYSTILAYRIIAWYQKTFPAPEVLVSPEVLLQQRMWQDFCQEYREKYRANRDREIRLAFAERETIPEDFEDDEVLSQYICPITLCPIRYAVIDPTTNTMYERAAIEAWIDANHSSPTSRRPLERESLIQAI